MGECCCSVINVTQPPQLGLSEWGDRVVQNAPLIMFHLHYILRVQVREGLLKYVAVQNKASGPQKETWEVKVEKERERENRA